MVLMAYFLAVALKMADGGQILRHVAKQIKIINVADLVRERLFTHVPYVAHAFTGYFIHAIMAEPGVRGDKIAFIAPIFCSFSAVLSYLATNPRNHLQSTQVGVNIHHQVTK